MQRTGRARGQNRKNSMKTVVMAVVALFLTTIISCRKSGMSKNIPACISSEIAANKNDPNWEIGSVEEYLFQNRVVYAFNPDGNIIADGSTTIKDSNCNALCYIGGFGGPTVNMCNGENFYQTATLRRTIWKKR